VNRREAIAALVSLPEITRISTAPVKADDVIVVECDQHPTMEQVNQIRSILESIWPGRKCLVLSKGFTLKVVAK
jgi:hypothetical protein